MRSRKVSFVFSIKEFKQQTDIIWRSSNKSTQNVYWKKIIKIREENVLDLTYTWVGRKSTKSWRLAQVWNQYFEIMPTEDRKQFKTIWNNNTNVVTQRSSIRLSISEMKEVCDLLKMVELWDQGIFLKNTLNMEKTNYTRCSVISFKDVWIHRNAGAIEDFIYIHEKGDKKG